MTAVQDLIIPGFLAIAGAGGGFALRAFQASTDRESVVVKTAREALEGVGDRLDAAYERVGKLEEVITRLEGRVQTLQDENDALRRELPPFRRGESGR